MLWDIDHTLISVNKLSRELYREVFEELIGRPPTQLAAMAGRTERAITTDTLRLHGIDPTDDLVRTFTTRLGRAFDEHRHELAQRGKELPGARSVLTALGDEPVVQSVLTGNTEPIARHKLEAFDLDGYLDLGIGAYGMDGVERPPLVRLAQTRAEAKYGERFNAHSTVLIGDTPHDVLAGHEGGARVVAVATGNSDEATLRAAGAELVLPDLTDTDAVVHAILNVTRP